MTDVEIIHHKEKHSQEYRKTLRFQWQAEKPKGKIIQIVEMRYLSHFKRKPFFGDACQKMTVLFDNGKIATHYFNEEYSLWQLYLFE